MMYKTDRLGEVWSGVYSMIIILYSHLSYPLILLCVSRFLLFLLYLFNFLVSSSYQKPMNYSQKFVLLSHILYFRNVFVIDTTVLIPSPLFCHCGSGRMEMPCTPTERKQEKGRSRLRDKKKKKNSSPTLKCNCSLKGIIFFLIFSLGRMGGWLISSIYVYNLKMQTFLQWYINFWCFFFS